MHGLYLLKFIDGAGPDIGDLTFYGFVRSGTPIGDWDIAIITGTAPELAAINQVPDVTQVAIWLNTDEGNNRQAMLDRPLPGNVRTQLNQWLQEQGQEAIPAGRSGREASMTIGRLLNDWFDVDNFDVVGPEDV